MKKLFLLILCLCLCLSGCGRSETPPATEPQQTQSPSTEAPETTLPQQTTEATTLPVETAAPTKAPRIPGPDILEGNAVTIENVTLDTCDSLPGSITSSSAYRISGHKEEYILDESRTYAVIQFTVTNRTSREIKVADVHDDFMVEMIYGDSYVYSSDTESACFFHSRSQTAIVCASYGFGLLTLSPLSTADVTVYMPCSVEVFENTQENLSVVFSCNYSGFEALEFIIR